MCIIWDAVILVHCFSWITVADQFQVYLSGAAYTCDNQDGITRTVNADFARLQSSAIMRISYLMSVHCKFLRLTLPIDREDTNYIICLHVLWLLVSGFGG